MKVILPLHIDQKTLYVRTGHAPLFGVFEVHTENKTFRLIKCVENNHQHHGHGEGQGRGNGHHHQHQDEDHQHNQEHQAQLLPLADCDYIIVLALGPHMKQALRSLDITPIMYKQSEIKTAEQALHKFLNEI